MNLNFSHSPDLNAFGTCALIEKTPSKKGENRSHNYSTTHQNYKSLNNCMVALLLLKQNLFQSIV